MSTNLYSRQPLHYDIATAGINSGNHTQIALQGLIWKIIVEDVTPPTPTPEIPSYGGGAVDSGKYDPWDYIPIQPEPDDEREILKRVIVIATIDGVEYKQAQIFKDLTITAQDIKLDVIYNEQKEPTIKIIVEKVEL